MVDRVIGESNQFIKSYNELSQQALEEGRQIYLNLPSSGRLESNYTFESLLIPGSVLKAFLFPSEIDNVNPYGIPDDWYSMPSKKGGGMKYVDPDNQYNQVRIMPGNPNSPNPLQQSPYVKILQDGKNLDIYGNVVPGNSAEAHIPLNQFYYPH